MERTSDVMATWAWGLRRYAWIVVLFVIGLGVLVPVVQSRSADVYHAQAQVGPSGQLLLPNLDPLPRFAQSVFDDGAVARDVRALLHLPPGASVIPGKVQLRAAQDNPVLVVTGRGSSPQEAATVANISAASLVTEMNRYSHSVGVFAVQSQAVAPSKPDPKVISGPAGVTVGALAGLVAGCGLVGLILAVRRPVVGAGVAQGVAGVPVLGKVPLARHGEPDEKARMALGALARRLLREKHEVIFVTGPVQSQADRVAAAVEAFFANVRHTRGAQAHPDSAHDKDSTGGLVPPEITTLDASSLETWVEPPDRCSLTLVVVPEGIRSSMLHRLVDQHRASGAAALVLVSPRHSWHPRRRLRKVAVPLSPIG